MRMSTEMYVLLVHRRANIVGFDTPARFIDVFGVVDGAAAERYAPDRLPAQWCSLYKAVGTQFEHTEVRSLELKWDNGLLTVAVHMTVFSHLGYILHNTRTDTETPWWLPKPLLQEDE